MTFLGAMSVLGFVLTAFTFVLPIEKAIQVLIVSAAFTTTAIAEVGDNSILAYHAVWAVVSAKMFFFLRTADQRIDMTWVPFLVFAFATIPLALLHENTVVINVESQFAYVRLSVQQLTQYGYLLIAVTTAMYVEVLLRTGVLAVGSVLKTMDVTAIVVIAIGFLQLVIPAEIINATIRNSVHVGYNLDGARISSTFQEPSMLSLFLMPLAAMHILRFIDRPNVLSVLVVTGALEITLLNSSSSAYLAFVAAALSVFLVLAKRILSERVAHGVILTAMISLAVGAVVVSSGLLSDGFSETVAKMSGEGVSGTERLESIEHTIGVVLENPIVGVGWGTSRCAVFFCWLSELGIPGFGLFVLAPMLRLLWRLWRGGGLSYQIFIYLAVALTLFFFVTSEGYYLSFWIVAGVGMCLASEQSTPQSTFSHGEVCRRRQISQRKAATVDNVSKRCGQ